MQTVVIIPARYGSTRLPGKPLADIGGKPMVQWVYENASITGYPTYVATDDIRIAEVVQAAYMPLGVSKTGTERCAKVADMLELGDDDIVINMQGDIPFIDPMYIHKLVHALMRHKQTGIVTLARPITLPLDPLWLLTNVVKIKTKRSTKSSLLMADRFTRVFFLDYTHIHIGVYGFRKGILSEIAVYEPGEDSLEQTPWLKSDYTIGVVEVDSLPISVDTKEDLLRANNYYKEVFCKKTGQ